MKTEFSWLEDLSDAQLLHQKLHVGLEDDLTWRPALAGYVCVISAIGLPLMMLTRLLQTASVAELALWGFWGAAGCAGYLKIRSDDRNARLRRAIAAELYDRQNR